MLKSFGLEKTTAHAVIPGDVFGRLTVVAIGKIPGTYRYKAVCKCTCGSDPIAIRYDHLRKGVTLSCGCLQKERSTTHGLSKSAHYDRWKNMMDRCYNEQCAAYPDYGARGIKVHEPWHDIATFIAELPSGFRRGLEIDRIDNDGNYEPGNIRWVTRQKNTTNRRSARHLTFNGKRQSLTDWSNETGLPTSLIASRIDEFGWTVTRALSEPIADRVENMRRAQTQRWKGHKKPVRKPPRVDMRFEYRGQMLTIRELAEICGKTPHLLRKQLIERRWPIDKVMKDPAA